MEKRHVFYAIITIVLLGFVLPFLISSKSTILVIVGCIIFLGWLAASYYMVFEEISKKLKGGKNEKV